MGGRTVPQIEREEKRKKEKRKRREKKRTSGPGNRILVLFFAEWLQSVRYCFG